MKTTKLLLLFLFIPLTGLLSGCALSRMFTDYGYERPYKFENKNMAKHDFTAEHGAKKYFRKDYDDFMFKSQTNEAKFERDAILGELMLLVNGAHGEFERDTRAIKTTADFISDLAVLGVTSAGTVAGGAATKAVLSAIAGGITGTKLAVNKDLLQEQAVEAIHAQMSASMNECRARIISNMTNSVARYPLELGLADISEYYYAGTFAHAIQSMVQEAKKKDEIAKAKVQDAISGTTNAANMK